MKEVYVSEQITDVKLGYAILLVSVLEYGQQRKSSVTKQSLCQVLY
jgi:hypothetical protein